jgi:hypothetical protein
VQQPWGDRAQRDQKDPAWGQTGLVDQSVNGGPVGDELEDARQGEDEGTRNDYQSSGNASSKGLNPYGESFDSRKEAAEKLASQYAAKRAEGFEHGAGRSNDQDPGTY